MSRPRADLREVAPGIIADRHPHGRPRRVQRRVPAHGARADPGRVRTGRRRPRRARGARRSSGSAPDDLAHLVVTHIHLDHAGGAGALLPRFPRADGLGPRAGCAAPRRPHAAGGVAPRGRTARNGCGPTSATPRRCDASRIRAVADGDRIALGDRALDVIAHTGSRVAPRRAPGRRDGRRLHGRGDRLAPAVGGRATGPRCPRPRSTSRRRSRASSAIRAAVAHRAPDLALRTGRRSPRRDANGRRRGSWRGPTRCGAPLDADPDARARRPRRDPAGRGGRRASRGRRRADRPGALRRDRLDRDERGGPRPVLAQALRAGGEADGRADAAS